MTDAAFQKIPIACIKDAGAQMREEMKPDVVREYADEMADGTIFPPITAEAH